MNMPEQEPETVTASIDNGDDPVPLVVIGPPPLDKKMSVTQQMMKLGAWVLGAISTSKPVGMGGTRS